MVPERLSAALRPAGLTVAAVFAVCMLLAEAIAALLLPEDGLLQRCWSLPPLSVPQQLAQQNLWDAAAPRP